MPREEFMKLAIEKAHEGATEGQPPFGACLVKEGEVISCVHNMTRTSMDLTAHAEIQALRESWVKLKSLDLTGCEIYATCEPCPMCFTACHYANVSTIVYGASLEDFTNSRGEGRVATSSQTKGLLGSPIQVVGGFLRDDAIQLFTT